MIRFIYFDVGGVTILDFTATNQWQELEKELKIHNSQEFIKFWDKYEPELCVGRDTETLIPLIKKQFGVNISSNYSLLIDGFVKRFRQNKSIWPVIKDFHKFFKIGLLTNMYPRMFEEIKGHNLLPDISWDVIIDSSIVKLKKPDPRFFELAEERAGVKGSEILFIDNTIRNIEAAKIFGWQTFLYDSMNPEKSNIELEILKEKIK